MKKLLIGIGVIILLVVAAAVVAPFVIPVGTYEAQLVSRVKEATGRDLKINGKVSFSVLPSLALEANDVTFSNPPGAAGPDMARFTKLEVALKLLPLLQRRIEIDKLVLVDPVIALEVDKQGRPNWQFATASAAPPAPAAPSRPAATPAPRSGAGGGLAGLTLDDVRLENGKISYLDQRSGESLTLDQIAMKLSLPGLDSPFTGDGSAVYRGEKMTLALALANPRSFLDGQSSAATLKLASTPVSFDFKGDASGSTPLKLDGAIDLSVPSVRGLAQWAGTRLDAPGTGFGPLAISGRVSLAGSKIGFSDAKLSLDAIKATGELALDTGGARPALKGRLDVDRLDANPYLPPETTAKPAAAPGGAPAPAAPSAGGGAPTSAASGWSDQPIELAPLKTADVDFALTANSLLYRKIQVGKSALALHLKNGRLETDLEQLALYQGAGKGKVVVDGSGDVPAIEAEFSLSQVQMQPLLKDAIDLDRLAGTGAFDLQVAGRGKSQRDIVGALNGKGDLNLGNGKLKGLNLVAMVQNVASAFTGGGQSAQDTDFASLTGTFTITSGILHNSDLQLKSAELPMTGAGTVDLPHRSVDYKITPKLAGKLAVPVLIKGPWDKLNYEPDLAGMIGNPSQLLQGGAAGVGSTLKGGASGAKDLLKGLLGGQK